MTDISISEHSDGELVVDSRLIADRLGIEHESFLKTIDTHQAVVEEAFGVIRFEIGKPKAGSKGGRPARYALLTENQATLLMTFSRNTPPVVKCKVELVQAFSKAKQLLAQRRVTDATLKIYLLDDPVKWRDRGRIFQEDFYKEVYRLQGWQFSPGKTQHPMKVAHITIDVVYQRLQPGVWEEMNKKNPRLNGKRKHCCHQFLSDNIGNPHLRHHLYAVTRIMQGCKSWAEFVYELDRFHPKTNTVQMDILFELFHHHPEEHDRWKRLAS